MRFGILGLILGVALSAQGQTPLEEMVKTEQAFSKMAEEKNTRDDFAQGAFDVLEEIGLDGTSDVNAVIERVAEAYFAAGQPKLPASTS